MNIQSVGLYSLFSTQNPQLRRDNCVHVPMNKKILQCDTVTFTSVAKSEPLKKLLKFGIPLLPHSLSFWFKSGFDKILLTIYRFDKVW